MVLALEVCISGVHTYNQYFRKQALLNKLSTDSKLQFRKKINLVNKIRFNNLYLEK